MLVSLPGVASAAGEAAAAAAAAVEELRQVELAFAASVMENRPEVFAGFLDEDAVFVSERGVTRGRQAIVEAWRGFFAAGRPYFEWHPEVVELAGDGTLGLTRGPWTIRSRDPQGGEVVQTGTFSSVWRRQPGGGWKIVFDTGCSPCPQGAEEGGDEHGNGS
jgi:ketosteroid isomerase-like protein